jgi:PAS domain S-box-containing protein
VLAETVSAQPRDIRFRRISVEDGLPAAAVRQVTQSSTGFMWLATQGGLSRYDGYEFVTYRHDPQDPGSLPHNDVRAVLEDPEGRIWVGIDGGGLSRFDPVSQSFDHFRHDPADPSSLSSDRVRCLLQDRDGVLWVGTDGAGLDRFSAEDGTFRHFQPDPGDPGSIGGKEIRQLVQDASGLLWIATADGGLSVLDSATDLFTHFRHDEANRESLSSDQVRSLYLDTRGTLWVGTYDGGLNRFDPVNERFDRFRPRAGDPTSLIDANVTTILEDSKGILWIGTNAGLDEWLPQSEGFRHHRHDGADPYSLIQDSVVSLFVDRGDVLWVGTLGGVSTWNTSTGRFQHYSRRSQTHTELSDNFVTSFAKGADGEVWVGTFSGLSRLDTTTGRFEQFRQIPGDSSSISDDSVMSVLVDRRGALWVGTLQGGLNRRNPGERGFVHFRSDPTDPSTVGSNGISAIIEDRDGFLWAGTYRGGLSRFDPRTERFTRYRHDPEDPTSLSSNLVTSVLEDADGAIWIGTEDGGLNRFERSTESFVQYRSDPDDPRSLSGDDAWLAMEDGEGNLWIGTRSAGLNKWRAEDRRQGRAVFDRFSIEDGMAGSVVYAILDDGRGNLWLSTNSGLSRMRIADETFSNYDVTRGLQSDEFNFASAARIGDLLYFGGINGFNVFAPESIETNRHLPPVVLTGFLKFNEPVDSSAAPGSGEIELGHEDSVIGFEYAALDFTAPEQNRYRYMLEGLDRDWVDAGNMRLVTYTNLDPGEYTLRVQGSNNDGVWNEEGLAIGIVQAPPPWLSWWAYSIYAFLLAAVTLSTLVVLESRKRRAEELQRVNVSLEKEIHARRAKERALEAEKLKAREYLDVAEVVMVALNEAGSVLLINQKGCGVLGYREEEIVGSDWVGRFVPAQRQEEVRRILRSPDAFRYCEYPIVTRAGEERVVAWHSTHLPSASGGSPVILSSGTDNTEVRKLEKQVRMRQKMDALGTLAGGIAHDFNNILTAILGYSSLTLSRLATDSEESGYMRQVVQACERARDMVARILTFSRGGDVDRKPIQIGPAVQEACDLLQSSLPANVKLQASIEPDCLPVSADATQIHQVVMNLATNSSHAMHDGGLIEVAVEMIHGGSTAVEHADPRAAGSHVQITVKDNGHGMDKATLERVFDPFFTTKKVGSGTGLGLSVAHGIVSNLDGEIAIRSQPGRGTKVTILLPCCETADALLSTPSDENPRGSERILLVDDEKPILLLTKRWLEGLGYSVEPHADPVEALAAFRSRPRRFDLVVTDQSMPEMEGFELIAEVRQIRPDAPTVLTSGRRYRKECAEVGSIWLQKPYTLSDLANAVRQALDRSRPVLRSVG